MGYLERYVAEEHAADYQAGRISHAELLRRFTLLTGSAVAAIALAVTLGCSASGPTPTPTLAPTVVLTTTTAPTSPSPSATAAAPAAPGTVAPNDPAIEGGTVTFKNGDVTLMGYLAKPRTAGPHPAVLIIHENRGLLPHFPDVARRYAKEGYVALSLDLLSREGGTSAFTDSAQASATLARAGEARLVEDMNGAVKYLQGRADVRADRIGATGFCFGGGMVWLLAVRNPDIKAAVPYYGPRPPLAEVPNIRAAVLAQYGATDNRINSGNAELEAALKASQETYKFTLQAGAGHAFFNDTGGSYNATAAAAAWAETLAWFRTYLRS